MLAAAEHPRENTRLHVLRDTGLFKSEDDIEYEKFVTIASALAQTPIALFSLIGKDSQWFKAKIGLPISETPRSVSFCGHAILDEQHSLVVEDATTDARFSDNPLVTGDPGIRFYAGIPLRLSKDRLPIGTICVIDRKPRKLGPDILSALEGLGEILEQHITYKITLQRQAEKLRKTEEQVTELLRARATR